MFLSQFPAEGQARTLPSCSAALRLLEQILRLHFRVQKSLMPLQSTASFLSDRSFTFLLTMFLQAAMPDMILLSVIQVLFIFFFSKVPQLGEDTKLCCWRNEHQSISKQFSQAHWLLKALGKKFHSCAEGRQVFSTEGAWESAQLIPSVSHWVTEDCCKNTSQ